MSGGKVGLIAGYGRFPVLYAQALRSQGFEVFCTAIREEAPPEIAEVVDHCVWLRVGQLGRMIEVFGEAGVTTAVMAGKVHKTRIYQLRPDLRAFKLLARVPDYRDDTLLGAIAEELEGEGIHLASSIEYAGPLLPGPGVLTKRAPGKRERGDIDFGWPVAKGIAGLDIGQSVVVRERAVMAVEAIEGTDEAIRRGGYLGDGDVTVVKVAKPAQDVRFDVPTVGPDTIAAMAEAGATCLAAEAGMTLVLDQEEVVAAAQRAGISVVLQDGAPGPGVG